MNNVQKAVAYIKAVLDTAMELLNSLDTNGAPELGAELEKLRCDAPEAYGFLEALALLPPEGETRVCDNCRHLQNPKEIIMCQSCKSLSNWMAEPAPSSEKALREALVRIEESDKGIEKILGEPTFNQHIAREALLASSPAPEAPK